MSEEYTKKNDHTLCVTEEEKSTKGRFDYTKKITKTFNFLSAQVTTDIETWVGKWRGYQEGGATSISTTHHVQNFDDIQSTKEIEMMHKKLLEMDGKPPALENVLGQRYFPKSKTKGLG